jgi:hypothetical protein
MKVPPPPFSKAMTIKPPEKNQIIKNVPLPPKTTSVTPPIPIINQKIDVSNV